MLRESGIRASQFVPNSLKNLVFPFFSLFSHVLVMNQIGLTQIIHQFLDYDNRGTKAAAQLRWADNW